MTHDPSLPNLHSDDPRPLGGDIAGPGGPHERDAVVVDTRNAVMLDYTEVTLVKAVRAGKIDETVVALLMEGRVNKTTDRTRVVYMIGADGVAALVTELVGIAQRARAGGDPALADEIEHLMRQRYEDMP
jgi:hypothetical protein